MLLPCLCYTSCEHLQRLSILALGALVEICFVYLLFTISYTLITWTCTGVGYALGTSLKAGTMCLAALREFGYGDWVCFRYNTLWYRPSSFSNAFYHYRIFTNYI